ncbi:HNH endonuclease [Sulfitobacter sp. F26169L]|nr:HNH endonuclease [Sulfitobacter sp. F26169L]
MVAVTIGKWVPRDFDVDHINHDPSDNRPENLRVVTRRDNNGNRRRVRLSELADLNEVTSAMADRKAKKTQEILEPQETVEDPFAEILNTGPVTEPFFTGETKSAEHGIKQTWGLGILNSNDDCIANAVAENMRKKRIFTRSFSRSQPRRAHLLRRHQL